MKAALALAVLVLPVATPPGIDAVVARVNAAATEYMRVFRDLTAEETRVIEVWDDRGRLDKRREIVSDLLVYQTSRSTDVMEWYAN